MRAIYLALPLLAFASGCGEEIPPTPQAAFAVNFQDSGAECPHKSHTTDVGMISGAARTTVLVDGVNGADISCTVSGAGPFSVNAKVIVGADGLVITVPAITTGAKKDAPATGGVSFFSATTLKSFNSASDTPCSFYFLDGTPEGVAPGKAWMAFTCPKMIESMSTCAIGESYVILENCNQ